MNENKTQELIELINSTPGFGAAIDKKYMNDIKVSKDGFSTFIAIRDNGFVIEPTYRKYKSFIFSDFFKKAVILFKDIGGHSFNNMITLESVQYPLINFRKEFNIKTTRQCNRERIISITMELLT